MPSSHNWTHDVCHRPTEPSQHSRMNVKSLLSVAYPIFSQTLWTCWEPGVPAR